MTSIDDVPSGGGTDRVLTEALRLAHEIWTNEDRNVEHRPGYDPALTVAAAVDLAGAVIGVDAYIRTGMHRRDSMPLTFSPRRWSRIRSGN